VFEVVWRNDPGVMLGAKALGDLRGIIALVERCDIEADRAGLDRVSARLGHQGNDAGAVHPARKKRPQRHIGDHARGHRVAQQMQQFGLKVRRLALAALCKGDIPPLHRPGHWRIVAQQ
jgi:hypothetical protein